MMMCKFGKLIALALWWRRKPHYVGLCQACRMSVRTDDEWRAVGLGVAHRECVEYIARSKRREHPLAA